MADLAEPVAASDAAVRAAVAPAPRRAAAVRSVPAVRQFILILLAIYVVKQGAFVFGFRPFTGHDEVAHYSYLRTVATEGRVPVLPDLERWRAEIAANRTTSFDLLPDELYRYCRYTLDWFCEPDHPRWSRTPPHIVTLAGDYYPSGFQYAANHPPLYYLVMSPLYWASAAFSPETQQYLLRLAAIPFGLATVFLAFRLVRALFPGDGFLAVTVPAFVAFQPQISYEAAMVNNDILCIALYSWILYLLVVSIRDRFPPRTCVLLGFVLGLALLTKGTSLTAAPLIAVAIVAALGWRRVRTWVGRGALVAIPAAVLAAPWYAFLFRTYGNLDGLDQIEQLQYWNRPAGTFFGMLFSRDFVVMRWKETWGKFGWRLIHLDPVLLWAIAIPLIVAVGGLVQYLIIVVRRGDGVGDDDPVLHPRRWQWLGLLVLAAACAVAYLAVVQFGTRFALTQARYFFPVVNAAALLLMLGLRTIVPRAYHATAQIAVVAALVLLNVLIFAQYVIPHYLNTGA